MNRAKDNSLAILTIQPTNATSLAIKLQSINYHCISEIVSMIHVDELDPFINRHSSGLLTVFAPLMNSLVHLEKSHERVPEVITKA